jgi:hypothetical protein
MQSQRRGVWALVLFASLIAGAWVGCQHLDGGLNYAKEKLGDDPDLKKALGEPLSVIIFKVRYMERERKYWAFISGPKDSYQGIISVIYDENGVPRSAKFTQHQ